MDKQLFKHLEPSERSQMLKDNCDKIEEQSYMKQFTHEEIALMKDSLAEVSIKLNDIAIEKKAINEDFTFRQKPMMQEKKGLLQHIKRKAIEVNEECYKFIDQENNQVNFYNSLGDLVFMRPILQGEKQKTIFTLPKSGTSDK